MSQNDDPPEQPAEAQSDEQFVYKLVYEKTFSLEHRILPQCTVAARLEPRSEETIVAVSTSNKVILHSTETSLNIVDKIRCLKAICFNESYDFLAVGTESQLIVYDVYKNSTLFQKEIPDGINTFAFGKLGTRNPLIFCGGNCAIWGFDSDGSDAYWTVTGDSVTTMCLCDVDDDGSDELVVGSPDNEIRIFKDDLMRTEFMETDSVMILERLTNNTFAYGLKNGTLGIYDRGNRTWRIKSKNNINSVLFFPEYEDVFLCVWHTGKVDVRWTADGNHILPEKFETDIPVAKAFVIAIDGGEPKIAISGIDGKVAIYNLEKRTGKVDKTLETLRDYGQLRHSLMMQLTNFENEDAKKDKHKEDEFKIPADTQVEVSLKADLENRTLYMNVSATNDISIRAVAAFAEGAFEGDSFLSIPQDVNSNKMKIPILTDRDTPSSVSVRTLLGHPKSNHMILYECLQALPRFARFVLLAEQHKDFVMPQAYVECNITQNIHRIIDWVISVFMIDSDVTVPVVADESRRVELHLLELAPKKELSICIQYDEGLGKLSLFVDELETAGNIIQSMISFFDLGSLSSTAYFPNEFGQAETIIGELDDMYSVRDRLLAELSSQMNTVKEVVVRAEDAIYMDDIKSAQKYYNRLKFADQGMRQAFLVKSNNHERLVRALRNLNKIIENSSKLRAGEHSRNVISSCRSAILEDNKPLILKILQFGPTTSS